MTHSYTTSGDLTLVGMYLGAFCAITQLYGDASSKQLTALPPNSPTGPAQVPGR